MSLKSVQQITLDFHNNNYQTINMHQYDDGQFVEVSITDNGDPIQLDNTYTINVKIETPDGRHLLLSTLDVDTKDIKGTASLIEITNNKLRIHFSSGTTLKPGIEKCEIALIKDYKISTVSFKVLIEKSVYDMDEVVDEAFPPDVVVQLRTEMQSYKTQAENAAKNANDSKDAAATSATNAVNSATNASNSATSANASKEAAKISETNAANSATSANSSKEAAKISENNALASKNAAKTSETNAKTSETNANASKVAAKASEDNANASKVAAKTSETNAANSASSALTSANNASNSATASANSATNSANSANTSAAKASESSASAIRSENSATASANSATTAGVHEDNAKLYYEKTKEITQSITGALKPKGTFTFEQVIAKTDVTIGDMFNISNDFISTDAFKDGSGKRYGKGSNMYMLDDGKWDVLASPSVGGTLISNTEPMYQSEGSSWLRPKV